MDEENEENSDDINFWLTTCAVLTVLCYTFFGILFFLLRRIVNDAFKQLIRSRSFKPKIETVLPLINPAAITSITHQKDERCLILNLSLHTRVSMFVLRNVPLVHLHNAMLLPTADFLQFLRNRAAETFTAIGQNISVKTSEERIKLNEFRNSYDLVLAFFDETNLENKSQEERVVLSFCMVHVKQHPEERRPTEILYSYCKTNRDRLIFLRELFSIGNGAIKGEQQKWPDCVICLTEDAADVIFVPCRHVAMCKKCLPSFQASSKCLHCPVCRGVIVGIKLL